MKIYWPIGLTREMPGRTNRSDLFDQTLNDYARSGFEALLRNSESRRAEVAPSERQTPLRSPPPCGEG